MTLPSSVRRTTRGRAVLGLTIASLLAGLGACSKSDDNAPLAFVPAQTPYVFANFEPVDDDVLETWTRMAEPVRVAYADMLAKARAKIAKGGTDPEKAQRALAMMELFEDKLTLEGWEKIGFTREGRMAMYGVGVLPVIRVELGDPEALRAFIGELETRSGKTFPVAEANGQSYWRFMPEQDKPLALVAAIIDSHLVLTVDAGSAEAPLAALLGLDRPAETVLDTGELVELNKQYGFGPHGTFLVDARRLAAALFGVDGQDTWFTQTLASEGTTLSPACRGEFTAMADNFPRMVSGYTNLGAQSMDTTMVLELKPTLAQGLVPVAAPVPGLGAGNPGPAVLDFGFGLKLDKLAEFIQAQASAIRAAPYACEHLSSFNEGAEQVGQQMAGLYMAAGWFTGMRAVLTDLTFGEGGKPETVDGALVIASPSPAGLIGMLKGFVPQLAELDLVANADPVPVALGEMAGMGDDVPPTFAAMTDTAIGLGFGAAAQGSLKGYLAAPAGNPAPLMHMGYNGAFYGRMMKHIQGLAGTAGADDAFPGMDEGDLGDEIFDGEDIDGPDIDGLGVDAAGDAVIADDTQAAMDVEDMQAVFKPLMDSINAIYEAIDYTATDITATERGIEMRQTVRLK